MAVVIWVTYGGGSKSHAKARVSEAGRGGAREDCFRSLAWVTQRIEGHGMATLSREGSAMKRRGNPAACWAVESGIAYEPAVAALFAYLAEEVLPHAVAEEHSIYRVAGARADLADTVNEMTAEHRVLTSTTQSLANAQIGK